ncbi:MAG: D-aminoacyl-tRNA deacylase [Actinomycetota bacterium]|nr:D-aminoacyl-tRNA deacylase [Actinomycetota bacterium]
MRAVVQRVSSAAVTVDGEEVGRIGAGMMVLLGVTHGDGPQEAERMATKLLKLRIFEDGSGRMNEPLGEREVLCVSQFTLYADTSSGNRPGFKDAAPGDVAEPLYRDVCERLDARTGVFGADMKLDIAGDGPVTILIDV